MANKSPIYFFVDTEWYKFSHILFPFPSILAGMQWTSTHFWFSTSQLIPLHWVQLQIVPTYYSIFWWGRCQFREINSILCKQEINERTAISSPRSLLCYKIYLDMLSISPSFCHFAINFVWKVRWNIWTWTHMCVCMYIYLLPPMVGVWVCIGLCISVSFLSWENSALSTRRRTTCYK